jgi:hypothetical protein
MQQKIIIGNNIASKFEQILSLVKKGRTIQESVVELGYKESARTYLCKALSKEQRKMLKEAKTLCWGCRGCSGDMSYLGHGRGRGRQSRPLTDLFNTRYSIEDIEYEDI